VQAAVDVVLQIHRQRQQQQDRGHILVFLTGQEEIEKACALINAAVASSGDSDDDSGSGLLVLPLYASLPTEDQQKVFQSADFILKNLNRGGTNRGRGERNREDGEAAVGSSNSTRGRQQQSSSGGRYTRKCVVATNIAETSITVPQASRSDI
jgi:HrpA-like RNA helicase